MKNVSLTVSYLSNTALHVELVLHMDSECYFLVHILLLFVFCFRPGDCHYSESKPYLGMLKQLHTKIHRQEDIVLNSPYACNFKLHSIQDICIYVKFRYLSWLLFRYNYAKNVFTAGQSHTYTSPQWHILHW